MQDALIHLMVVTAAADRTLTGSETDRIAGLVGRLPVFDGYDTGRIGPQAEVAGRRHQAAAEVMRPDAVDDDSCGERVGGIDDGLCQFEPTAAMLEGLAVFAGQ